MFKTLFLALSLLVVVATVPRPALGQEKSVQDILNELREEEEIAKTSATPDPIGLGWFLAGLALLVVGATLIHKKGLTSWWALGVSAAGAAVILSQAGLPDGVSLWPGDWNVVALVLPIAWTMSRLTDFTKFDDLVVSVGSIGGFLVAVLGDSLLGRFGLKGPDWMQLSPLWWGYELIWAFLFGDAILKSSAIGRWLKVLSITTGWYLIGIIS